MASSTSAHSLSAVASSSTRTTDITRTFPLTTIFHPPTDCALPILSSDSQTANYWVYGSDHSTTTYFASATSCYPSSFYLDNSQIPLYSPGACPSGFEAIAATTVIHPDTVTYATCCPTGNGRKVSLGAFCDVHGVSEVTFINYGTTSIASGNFAYEYPPIVVAWASSDLSKFTPASAPLRAYQAASSTIATGSSVGANKQTTRTTHGALATATNPGPSSTSSTSPKDTSSQSGLSTGASAGIGVGVALGAIIVIGLVIWALFIRRKRRKHDIGSKQDGNPSQTQWFEKRASNPGDLNIMQSPRYEMHGESMRPEMDSDSMRAEMPSGWQGHQKSNSVKK